MLQVTDGVWVAVGYALANSILLEGREGLVVVDVTECERAARKIRDAFSRISNKSIVAVIYTHNHQDHTSGARVCFAI